jgi:hypothetical protein
MSPQVSPILPNRDFLPQIINRFDDPKVIEVGVEFGGYTDIYYDQVTSFNGHIWLLDLWQTEGNDEYFSQREGQVEEGYEKIKKKYSQKENVTLIKGSAFEKHEEFEDEFFDWIYIDCDHTYEGISKNIEVWWPKLKKNGVFSGHDYNPDPENEFYDHMEINKAVDENFGRGGSLSEGFQLTQEQYYQSWYLFK